MAKYDKKDCRNNGGQIKTPASKYPKLVNGTTWFTGQNRHERRAEKARRLVSYKMKGIPGFKLIRGMFRAYGTENVLNVMAYGKQAKRRAK